MPKKAHKSTAVNPEIMGPDLAKVFDGPFSVVVHGTVPEQTIQIFDSQSGLAKQIELSTLQLKDLNREMALDQREIEVMQQQTRSNIADAWEMLKAI